MIRRILRTCSHTLITVIVVLGGLPQPCAFAQGCPELVGRWPYGPAIWAVAASGTHVYFESGSGMRVADISDPTSPQVVGEVALPDLVREIALSGSYAYVADFEAGLRVIDVSTPSAPVEVGFFDMPGIASGVTVRTAASRSSTCPGRTFG